MRLNDDDAKHAPTLIPNENPTPHSNPSMKRRILTKCEPLTRSTDEDPNAPELTRISNLQKRLKKSIKELQGTQVYQFSSKRRSFGINSEGNRTLRSFWAPVSTSVVDARDERSTDSTLVWQLDHSPSSLSSKESTGDSSHGVRNPTERVSDDLVPTYHQPPFRPYINPIPSPAKDNSSVITIHDTPVDSNNIQPSIIPPSQYSSPHIIDRHVYFAQGGDPNSHPGVDLIVDPNLTPNLELGATQTSREDMTLTRMNGTTLTPMVGKTQTSFKVKASNHACNLIVSRSHSVKEDNHLLSSVGFPAVRKGAYWASIKCFGLNTRFGGFSPLHQVFYPWGFSGGGFFFPFASVSSYRESLFKFSSSIIPGR